MNPPASSSTGSADSRDGLGLHQSGVDQPPPEPKDFSIPAGRLRCEHPIARLLDRNLELAKAGRPQEGTSWTHEEFIDYEMTQRSHSLNVVVEAILEHGEPLDAEQCMSALAYLDRRDRPVALTRAFDVRAVTLEALRSHLASVWSMAEYPDRVLSKPQWRRYFDLVGFTIDGRTADRPDTPVELFRGTVPARKRDWSWTTDLAVAEKFAYEGVRGRPPGKVYTAVVDPTDILGVNTERDESEYIIDARRITIRVASQNDAQDP
jgi:hypothetical protein